MNKRNRAQASSLFLLELTMAILFFSIASAVCVQIFVKSRAMSLHAEELNAAVREVSSAAEIVRASKSRAEAEEMIRSFYGDAVIWTETAVESMAGMPEENRADVSDGTEMAVESMAGMPEENRADVSDGTETAGGSSAEPVSEYVSRADFTVFYDEAFRLFTDENAGASADPAYRLQISLAEADGMLTAKLAFWANTAAADAAIYEQSAAHYMGGDR